MSNPTKKTYYCLNAVRHNGERYTRDISLTAEEAKPLLSAKAITKTNPNAAAEAAKKAEALAEKEAAEAAKKAEAKAKKEQEAADKKAEAEAEKNTELEPAPEASANTADAN